MNQNSEPLTDLGQALVIAADLKPEAIGSEVANTGEAESDSGSGINTTLDEKRNCVADEVNYTPIPNV